MKKKQYLVRVNCPGYQDILVTAASKEEAKDKAVAHFQCESADTEFGEFLPVGSSIPHQIIDD